MLSSMTLKSVVQAVQWREDRCILLDQTRLPSQEIYLECTEYPQVIDAIKRLAVRGAPAIGVAGAYAVVLASRSAGSPQHFAKALEEIAMARPTAVNLRWAVRRMAALVEGGEIVLDTGAWKKLAAHAKRIHDEDIEWNARMAKLGADLLKPNSNVITYCNTGDLATGGIGTAFGVLHQGFKTGKVKRVFPCETRPVGQGLRLTVWELQKNQIPFTLICDNMAALTMRDQKIGAVILGADRIAANGDAANKVGTYSLAVLAKHHGIPFYVVAPSSTFDLRIESGKDIPIEERASHEILDVLGSNRHPFEVPVHNPSFDVTPHELITAIICERGVIHAPSSDKVRAVLGTS